MNHPWITKNCKDTSIDLQLLETLRKCRKFNTFQRHILEILTSLLSNKDIIYIINAFNNFDEDFSGTLNLKEFKQVFVKLNYDITEDEIADIFERMADPDKGEITWTSFLYASLDRRILNSKNLKSLFKFLDSDENDYLTYESLKRALIRRGHKDHIDEVLKEAGLYESDVMGP